MRRKICGFASLTYLRLDPCKQRIQVVIATMRAIPGELQIDLCATLTCGCSQ